MLHSKLLFKVSTFIHLLYDKYEIENVAQLFH